MGTNHSVSSFLQGCVWCDAGFGLAHCIKASRSVLDAVSRSTRGMSV